MTLGRASKMRGQARAVGVSAFIGALLLSACTQTARITDVYMSLDPDGSRKRNIFFTDTKEIHCITEVGIGRKGVTLETLIRMVQRYDYEKNVFVEADRIVGQAENTPAPSDGAQTIDLKLDKSEGRDEEPYPAGRYVCESRLDGDIGGTAVFNVLFPDCPTAQIYPGTACVGDYPSFLVCPQYGASSTEPAKCQCTPNQGWKCPP